MHDLTCHVDPEELLFVCGVGAHKKILPWKVVRAKGSYRLLIVVFRSRVHRKVIYDWRVLCIIWSSSKSVVVF